LQRQWAVCLQQRRQVQTLQILHHDERSAALESSDVHDAGDVFALELAGGAGFAQEAIARTLGGQGLRHQELHRHSLGELPVRGGDDDAHATLTQDAIDAVLPREHVARLHVEHGS
jgi:hypothetical protein